MTVRRIRLVVGLKVETQSWYRVRVRSIKILPLICWMSKRTLWILQLQVSIAALFLPPPAWRVIELSSLWFLYAPHQLHFLSSIREGQRPTDWSVYRTEPRPLVPKNRLDRSRSSFGPVLILFSVWDRRGNHCILLSPHSRLPTSLTYSRISLRLFVRQEEEGEI